MALISNRLIPVILIICFISSCQSNSLKKKESFWIRATAFNEGSNIPKKFTADGEDISPSLEWGGELKGIKSFAIIMEDPDAPMGTWIHWVIYNIPKDKRELPENIEKKEKGSFYVQGKNSWGKIGYNGPSPPKGPKHRYFFRLYGLDKALDLPPALTAQELRAKIKNHILKQASFMAKYGR